MQPAKVDSIIVEIPESITGLHLNGCVAPHIFHNLQLYLPHTNTKSLTLAGFELQFPDQHHLSFLTGLFQFSTYAPHPRGFNQLPSPSGQLEPLLQALPLSVTDLNISDVADIPVTAVPLLATLIALKNLCLGCIFTSEVILSLAEHFSALLALRSFRARWRETSELPLMRQEYEAHLSSDACEQMLCSLQNLPHLCPEDACPADLVALSKRRA